MKKLVNGLFLLIMAVVLSNCAASTIEDETIEETNKFEFQKTEQGDSVGSGGSGGNPDPDNDED